MAVCSVVLLFNHAIVNWGMSSTEVRCCKVIFVAEIRFIDHMRLGLVAIVVKVGMELNFILPMPPPIIRAPKPTSMGGSLATTADRNPIISERFGFYLEF